MQKSIHSSAERKLRELMVTVRKNAGLTQQQLAKKLGKPQSFVAKYEGGERRLDIVEFATIIKALGADPVRVMRTFMRLVA